MRFALRDVFCERSSFLKRRALHSRVEQAAQFSRKENNESFVRCEATRACALYKVN